MSDAVAAPTSSSAPIATASRTYEGTLGALDLATRELDFAVTIASHLELVDGTPDVRAAFAAVVPKTTELGSKIILSGPLYHALLGCGNMRKGLTPATFGAA